MMQRILAALAVLLSFIAVPQVLAQGNRAAASAKPVEVSKQGGEEEETEIKVPNGGKIAAPWTAMTDRSASLDKTSFAQEGAGWHVRTARSVTLYRASDNMSGNYTVKATLKQTEGTPGHAESYGIFLGGKGLGGEMAKQGYTSFTIRGDGKFQIRRRAKGKGVDVTNGSVESAALQQLNDKGQSTNEISVVVGATDVRFLINGKEVHKAARADVDTDGHVAIRVSHNLDIAIPSFTVVKG